MLPNALKCLDAYRNIGLIIAQRLRAVNDILKTAGGRFSQSRARRHFRRMEILHIQPRCFLKIRGSAVLRSKMPACSGQAGPSRRRARFCEAECPRAAGRQTPAGGGRGFVKQNSRLQRASRPQPEASAVLRSRIPACGGQAGPSRRRARFCETECPLAAGKQTLAGGGRGFVKPPARGRRAGGGKLSWPQHAGHPVRRRKACLPRSFGCSRRQSPPWPPFGLPWGAGCMLCRSRKGKGFRLLARLRLWQLAPALGRSRKERQGRGGKGLCAPPCGHTKNAPAAHVGAAGAEGRNTGGTAPGFIPLTAAC